MIRKWKKIKKNFCIFTLNRLKNFCFAPSIFILWINIYASIQAEVSKKNIKKNIEDIFRVISWRAKATKRILPTCMRVSVWEGKKWIKALDIVPMNESFPSYVFCNINSCLTSLSPSVFHHHHHHHMRLNGCKEIKNERNKRLLRIFSIFIRQQGRIPFEYIFFVWSVKCDRIESY